MYVVELSGPETYHVPRPNPEYWEPQEIELETGEKTTIWKSKSGEPVMLPAYAKVYVQAVNEDVAKARALAANEQCDTVTSCQVFRAA